MRNELFALWLLFGTIPMATAQVSVEINLPGASIGINQPVYPDLVAVPGYPVYYAPQVNSNYFFYDGMYWVYARDNWYASSWYNGPWGLVGPDAVPLFILRVPVQYYREPPAYFHGWSADAAPRWDDHWGNAWTQRRQGWDTWDHAAVPAPAPLPTYQRQYTGRTYPAVAQQQVLQTQNYRYQPKEVVVHQAAQAAPVKPAPASTAPQAKNSALQAQHGSMPVSPSEQGAAAAHRGQPPKPAGAEVQRSAAAKAAPEAAKATKQQTKEAAVKPQAQKAQAQNKAPAPEPKVAHQAQPKPQAVAQHQAPRPPQTAQHQEAEPKSQEKAPQGKEPAQEARPGQEKG